MNATDVTDAPDYTQMATKELDALIRSRSAQHTKLQRGVTRHEQGLYQSLSEMERRYNKQERYRTDLKALKAPGWHQYLVSRGVQPATFRKWKSRNTPKQAKLSIAQDINVMASSLVRDIESASRKNTIEYVVDARAQLNPPIRKSLLLAMKNAASDMLNSAKLLSEVKDAEANGKCYQRIRREQMALMPEPELAEKKRLALDFKENATVREITYAEAQPLILANEYLGSSGSAQFHVGLFIGPYLAGVESFGRTAGSRVASSICGDEHKDKVLTIVRGACKFWAPKNAGSYLLSRACDLMAKKGFPIICAFSDPAGSEIGTLYSAVNFKYCSMTQPSERYTTPDGKTHDARKVSGLTRDRRDGKLAYIRTRAEQKKLLLEQGCVFSKGNAKHRFVLISGSPTVKRQLRKALKWETFPYPKREQVAEDVKAVA
jgi:hypothetical protein